MVNAQCVKMYADNTNSANEARKQFQKWLNACSVEEAITKVAKSGAYVYSFGIPMQFEAIAKTFFEELGYKVNVYHTDDREELYGCYVRLSWREAVI